MAQVNDIEPTSHTIAVYAENGELKQLDEKFIPDTIARKEDIFDAFEELTADDIDAMFAK